MMSDLEITSRNPILPVTYKGSAKFCFVQLTTRMVWYHCSLNPAVIDSMYTSVTCSLKFSLPIVFTYIVRYNFPMYGNAKDQLEYTAPVIF